MINNTNIKVPNKYSNMIKELDYEGKDYGYWAYTEDGYKFTNTDCHSINEYRVVDMLKEIRNIEKCDCDQCNEMPVEA